MSNASVVNAIINPAVANGKFVNTVKKFGDLFYEEYDSGLIKGFNEDNGKVIHVLEDELAHKHRVFSQSLPVTAYAFAVVMSSDTGKSVDECLPDANKIVDYGINAGEWKYALAFCNDPELQWIDELIINRDKDKDDFSETNIIALTESNYTAWSNAVKRFPSPDSMSIDYWHATVNKVYDYDYTFSLNGHCLYDTDNVDSKALGSIFGRIDAKMLCMVRTLLEFNKELRRLVGKDVVVCDYCVMNSTFDALYARRKPLKIIVNDFVADAYPIWSNESMGC